VKYEQCKTMLFQNVQRTSVKLLWLLCCNTFVYAVIEHIIVNYLLKEQLQVFGLGRAFCLEECNVMF
jgi:hypothetical protein